LRLARASCIADLVLAFPRVSLLLVLMRHAMDGLKYFEQRLPVFQQAVHQLKQFNRDEARLKEVGYSANESNYP